jgi:hypothetical protein
MSETDVVGDLYRRKCTLVVSAGTAGLDLSNMHISFSTVQQDVETPNNCAIRVYNLSESTLRQVLGEFSTVNLQAGYQASFGLIFSGNIKQFRIGREKATDTYLDILAADGDMAYNFSVIGKTLSSGWTHEQVIKESITAMAEYGVRSGYVDEKGLFGGVVPNPRGKVMWGMPRAHLRASATSTGATWNISQGKVDVIPLAGYKPGEALVLTAHTGLIGRPEQTNEGVKARLLLNPLIDVGALVQIDNTSINRLINQDPDGLPIPYNRRWGVQNLATVAQDGLYRVYVAEHRGDTRGQEWYTEITCLAVNPITKRVSEYG